MQPVLAANVTVPCAPGMFSGAAWLWRCFLQAGFASPAVELENKVASVSAGAESAKDLLNRLKPFTSPEYHAALSEALLAVEADTGASVTLDGASAGYKKFADKVKVGHSCETLFITSPG